MHYGYRGLKIFTTLTLRFHDFQRAIGFKDATPISRAHLPRMLANLDWLMLTVVITDCYGEKITQLIQDERGVAIFE